MHLALLAFTYTPARLSLHHVLKQKNLHFVFSDNNLATNICNNKPQGVNIMAKILIVEDEKAINDLVKFNLELVGHNCYQVFDDETGLEEALKLKYDLIILDVMLPKCSGFEIMEQIKGTPVIFVTARSAVGNRIKGAEAGS